MARTANLGAPTAARVRRRQHSGSRYDHLNSRIQPYTKGYTKSGTQIWCTSTSAYTDVVYHSPILPHPPSRRPREGGQQPRAAVKNGWSAHKKRNLRGGSVARTRARGPRAGGRTHCSAPCHETSPGSGLPSSRGSPSLSSMRSPPRDRQAVVQQRTCIGAG